MAPRWGCNLPYDLDPAAAGRALALASKLPGAVVIASHEPAWFFDQLIQTLGTDCLYVVRVKGNRAWYPAYGLDDREWADEQTPREAVDLLLQRGCQNVVLQLLNEPDIELPPDGTDPATGAYYCDEPSIRQDCATRYLEWFGRAYAQARRWWGSRVRLSLAPLSQGNQERHAWWLEQYRAAMPSTDCCVIHCYFPDGDLGDDWGGGFRRYVQFGTPLIIGECNDDGRPPGDPNRAESYARYLRFLQAESVQHAWIEAACLFTLPGGRDDASKPSWWWLTDAILDACAAVAAEPASPPPFADVPISAPIPDPEPIAGGSMTQHFTPEQIADVLGCPLANVQTIWPLLTEALAARGGDSRYVQIAAIATVAVESGSFWPIHEISNYADRHDLIARYGQYWGRGLIQLTWEHNYRATGDRLGLDLVGNPDLAIEPQNAVTIFADFFATHGCIAAANAQDWHTVRLNVNGGYNGWDRYIWVVQQLLALPETTWEDPAVIAELEAEVARLTAELNDAKSKLGVASVNYATDFRNERQAMVDAVAALQAQLDAMPATIAALEALRPAA